MKTEKSLEINVSSSDALNICRTFMSANDGDINTQNIILNVFAELFDCSVDTINDYVNNKEKNL